jgi:hypothetical protein
MQVLGLRSRLLINFDVGYKDVGYGECGAVLGQLATCDFLLPAQFEADGFLFQGLYSRGEELAPYSIEGRLRVQDQDPSRIYRHPPTCHRARAKERI